MLWPCPLLVLLVAPAGETDADPAAAPPEGVSEAAAEAPEIRNAVLRTAGLSGEELATSLQLRAPELSTHQHRAGTFKPAPDELYAYVDVRPHEAGGIALTIILSDGRAYDRHIEVTGEHAPRAVATAIAQLVDAIEHHEIEHDRGDVAVPPPEEAPEPEPEPEPAPQPAPEPEPAPQPQPEPAFELGVPVYGPAIFGLGPPEGHSPVVALGAGIGIDARLGSGAMVGADVRVAGRGASGLTLTRIRIAVSGGYDLRRGAFELDARGRIGIEPWRVQRGGADERVENVDTGAIAPDVLLVAAVSATPGVRIVAGPVGLRLGLWTELALGGVVDGGLGAADIRYERASQDPVPLFRLGGLELGLGLQLGAWFELPKRRRRAASATG